MKIELVTDKNKEDFNKKALHPLQAWEWGDFREKTGNKAVRLANFYNGRITNSYQLMVHKVPKTNFQIGTLIKGPSPTKTLLTFLKRYAKEENIIFIKMEPAIPTDSGKIKYQNIDEEKTITTLKENSAVPGKTLFTPTTFWIDLEKTEDELLSGFNSKTRYNIRLAKRKGVEVFEDNSDEAFNIYLNLTRETVERQGFYSHTQNYHKLLWQVLHKDMVKKGKSPIARMLTAKYKNEIITTWIVFVWQNFIYYPYGASTQKYKNVMANNLLMWEAILYGKKHNLTIFDLWGREEDKGFTKFKEGYSPEVVKFLGTWDLVTHPLYRPYRIAESIRWQLLRARTKIGLVKPKF